MSQIEISCIGSDAIFTNTPNIFSGGNVDSVKFTFDSDWSGFTTKTAAFYTNPKETALQILDSNNVAKIPANMTSNKGKLSIGVIGTNANNDDVKTSKILTYIVGKGAVTDDMETTSATPDIWLQLLSIVGHNKQIVDNMKLEVDESQMENKVNINLSNVTLDVFRNKGVLTIETGTYVGTGTSGINAKNQLMFGFAPQIVWVYKINQPTEGDAFTFYRGANTAYIESYVGGNDSSFQNVTWNENSMMWYNGMSASSQYNGLNLTYRYIAIG